MTGSRAPQRGYALLIVLWSLALLALIGTRVLATGRQETLLAGMQRDTAALQAAADGGVQRAIFALLDSSSRHWDADGSVHAIQIGTVPVAVRAEDEMDKVNPNLAEPALLRELLLLCGADSGTAASVSAGIVEWRGDNGAAGSDAGSLGAAAAKYAAAGRDYAPPGAPFASVDELGEVLGMTPPLLERLRPHLTIFTDRDPNAATRDPVVARALSAVGQAGGNAYAAELGVVSVTADARGPGKSRYAVHVVVETNAQAQGRLYRILAYERIWNGMP